MAQVPDFGKHLQAHLFEHPDDVGSSAHRADTDLLFESDQAGGYAAVYRISKAVIALIGVAVVLEGLDWACVRCKQRVGWNMFGAVAITLSPCGGS